MEQEADQVSQRHRLQKHASAQSEPKSVTGIAARTSSRAMAAVGQQQQQTLSGKPHVLRASSDDPQEAANCRTYFVKEHLVFRLALGTSAERIGISITKNNLLSCHFQ